MRVILNYLLGVHLAVKARYYFLSLLVSMVVLLSAAMAAQFSGRQPATVALDVGVSVLRLLLPLVVVLLAQELICKEFDRRYYLISFSYPGSRWSFLIGRFAVVFSLAALQLLIVWVLLGWLVQSVFLEMEPASHLDFGMGYWVVQGFMMLDLFVVSAFVCFLAVISRTPGFVLIGAWGFVLVARSYGSVIQLLSENLSAFEYPGVYRVGIEFLGYLIPDLGGYDLRAVALYSEFGFIASTWPVQILSGLFYALGLLGLAALIINRRRFS